MVIGLFKRKYQYLSLIPLFSCYTDFCMPKPHGVNTKAVGEELIARLSAKPEKYTGIKVFYDHGDSSKPEVCQPTSYMGRRYGSDATLSAIDIVVVKGKSVLLAIEIEEHKVRPKVILGDVFGIVLADKIKIKGIIYSNKNSRIIIAMAHDGKGKLPEKYTRLERHLSRYFESKPPKVRIISCPVDELVKRVERLIRMEVGKKSKG